MIPEEKDPFRIHKKSCPLCSVQGVICAEASRILREDAGWKSKEKKEFVVQEFTEVNEELIKTYERKWPYA